MTPQQRRSRCSRRCCAASASHSGRPMRPHSGPASPEWVWQSPSVMHERRSLQTYGDIATSDPTCSGPENGFPTSMRESASRAQHRSPVVGTSACIGPAAGAVVEVCETEGWRQPGRPALLAAAAPAAACPAGSRERRRDECGSQGSSRSRLPSVSARANGVSVARSCSRTGSSVVCMGRTSPVQRRIQLVLHHDMPPTACVRSDSGE